MFTLELKFKHQGQIKILKQNYTSNQLAYLKAFEMSMNVMVLGFKISPVIEIKAA